MNHKYPKYNVGDIVTLSPRLFKALGKETPKNEVKIEILSENEQNTYHVRFVTPDEYNLGSGYHCVWFMTKLEKVLE